MSDDKEQLMLGCCTGNTELAEEAVLDIDIETDPAHADIEAMSDEDMAESRQALREGMEMSVKMCVMYATELLGLTPTYPHEAAWDKVVGRVEIDGAVYSVVVKGRKKTDLMVVNSSPEKVQ